MDNEWERGGAELTLEIVHLRDLKHRVKNYLGENLMRSGNSLDRKK